MLHTRHMPGCKVVWRVLEGRPSSSNFGARAAVGALEGGSAGNASGIHDAVEDEAEKITL